MFAEPITTRSTANENGMAISSNMTTAWIRSSVAVRVGS